MTVVVMNYLGSDTTYIDNGKHVALGFVGDATNLLVVIRDNSGMPRAFEINATDWRVYDVSIPSEQIVLKPVEV